MNVFTPLLFGVVLGYLFRKAGRKPDISRATEVAIIIMIFLLGVKTGEVRVSGVWLLASSLLFAVLTMAGSLFLALGVRS
jgi:uncharacterized membrane protein YbjE (DUF340 family)